jgi:SAM-dependent methyltransferase
MVAGPNVDIAVKSSYKWNEINDNYCDAVISGQAFEHIEFPWVTISEITRIVKPGGLICIIAPNGLGLHRYPVDCWRYYSDGMIALAKYVGMEVLHISTNQAPKNASLEWYGRWQDCMLIAKKPLQKIPALDIESYKCIPSELEKLNSGFISIEGQDYYEKWKLKNRFKKMIHIIKLMIKMILWPIILLRKHMKRKNTV